MNTPSGDPAASFLRDGFYLHREPLFPAPLLEAAVAGMDAIRAGEYDTGVPPQPSHWKPGDDPNKLCKIEMPQLASRAVMGLFRFPALGELAAAVTGADWVQIWWVQLLVKPPGDPEFGVKANVGWHQDRHYWQAWEEGSRLFTAWIALSDVTPEDGPMRFLRGSSRWGVLGPSDFYGQDHHEQQAGIPIPPGVAWEEVEATLPRGGVSFHDSMTYHASGPNRSGRPRRSFAVHLRTSDSRPVEDRRQGLTAFIDRPDFCPVIYNRRGGSGSGG
jgi:hypothetical protein